MNFLTRLFIKKQENPKEEETREALGKRAGILCIILNTLLAGGKIALGVISGAVSILADGFNNLTDCGSNVVSIIGLKMSGKPADKEHPFGHHRAESVSAMLISVIILVVAVELMISSVQKIITPVASDFSIALVIILSVAIVVKLCMFLINFSLYKSTDGETLLATALDSVTDSVATAVVLIAMIISHYTSLQLDGYAGAGVAIFIALAGVKLLKETISKLLGKAPDKEVVKSIEARVTAYKEVCGLHDLAVHSYGQNALYATVHVEVDAETPIMTAHELADTIERDFLENTDIILTVHIDPLVFNDPIVNELKDITVTAVKAVDEGFKIHDFRVVGGDTRSNVVFDVAVPFDAGLSDDEILKKITFNIQAKNPRVGVVATIERQNLI